MTLGPALLLLALQGLPVTVPAAGPAEVEHFVLLHAPQHPEGRRRVEASPLLADVDPFVRAGGVLRRTRLEEEGSLYLETELLQNGALADGSALHVVHSEELRPPGEAIEARLLFRELFGRRSRTLRAEIPSDRPTELRVADAALGDTWHGTLELGGRRALPATWLEALVRGEVRERAPRLFDPTTRTFHAHAADLSRPPGPAPLWSLVLTRRGGGRATYLFCGRSLLAFDAGRDAPLAVRVGADRYAALRRAGAAAAAGTDDEEDPTQAALVRAAAAERR